MMNKQKTAKARILKYSLIVPLALALVISSNAQNVVSKAKTAFAQAQDSVSTKKKQVKFTPPQTLKTSVKFTPPTITEDKLGVYSVVEKMPQYPGGENELINYIGRSLIYPLEAMQNSIQGTVITRFVVNALGKVEKTEVLRSVDPTLDKEALRVIKSLPDFIPGEQSGKKVAVWYTLPITFKLEGDSKPMEGNSKAQNGSTIFSKPPLVVVNGKIQPKDFSINSIKPETIESVNVIKANSETIKAELVTKYGEAAANGVVEITTKK